MSTCTNCGATFNMLDDQKHICVPVPVGKMVKPMADQVTVS